MSAHAILAILSGEATGDRAVLDATLAVAAPKSVEITALHVKADPQSIIPLLGDGMSGAMAGQVIEAIERDAALRAVMARETFVQWAREHRIPTRSAQADSTTCAIWQELTGRAPEAAAYLGRNADLLVLARRQDMPGMGIIEGCLFNSGRPVLLAPAVPSVTFGARAGVFWNASAPAARALGDAMPLLRKAQRVTIYTTGAEGPAPTADELAHRLTGRGITAVVDMVSSGSKSTADALLATAERDGVDLIVMGAYGHSRFREMILGGVTRAVIENGRAAAFLAH